MSQQKKPSDPEQYDLDCVAWLFLAIVGIPFVCALFAVLGGLK